MSNQESLSRPINKEVFLRVLKERKSSIRKLGEAYEIIQRTERTIRRYLEKGVMPSDLLNSIASFLDVDPDYLAGKYYDSIMSIPDPYAQRALLVHHKAEKHPYLSASANGVDFEEHFYDTISSFRISKTQYKELPAEKRVSLRKEIDYAICEVLSRYFRCDSLGEDMELNKLYLKSQIDEYDPFGYYEKTEGIGLSNDELQPINLDDVPSGLEEKWVE